MDRSQRHVWVPKGLNTWPLSISLLNINDQPDLVKSHSSLFADDTIIYLTIDSVDDWNELQTDLLNL